ncbi:MAG TPA: hypothetical protein VK846_18730 [Candidatus Limnocylindria bacterium]|nr:hypothetical protein [Candidatus Limnocylindria bacterium]
MNKNVVQWVMLRKTEFLAKQLGLPLRRKLAEYQTTDFGIIDFAFDTSDDEIAVIELETGISSTAKLDFCLEQSLRYKKLATIVPQPLRVFILYDRLGTPLSFQQRLTQRSSEHGLELRSYSMLDVKSLYQRAMDELEKTSGIYLGRPVATNLTHLRLLNRILLPFATARKEEMTQEELRRSFSPSASRTMFTVRKNLAAHFELFTVGEASGGKMLSLTDYGRRFCENMTYAPLAVGHEFDLSHAQRRVLLESLTNGQFTKSKVNIYYFLRFIHLTNGEWVPKEHGDIGKERLTYLNNFLGTSYLPGPLTRLIRFTFNQASELGLVDSIETGQSEPTFKAFLTSLGSRVLGFLELYLHLKREQLQIPLQN